MKGLVSSFHYGVSISGVCLFLVLCGVYGQGNDTLFIYKRTACFGRCPVFELIVFSDYSVIWRGKDNVSRTGIYKLMPDSLKEQKAVIKRILKRARKCLKKIDTLCVQNISDIPSIIVKHGKKRYYYHCVNARPLTDCMKEMEEWIEKAPLIRIDKKE